MIASLTAAVALAGVDGAGSLVKMEVDGSITKLERHQTQVKLQLATKLDVRDSIYVQPNSSEELDTVNVLELLRNRLGNSYDSCLQQESVSICPNNVGIVSFITHIHTLLGLDPADQIDHLVAEPFHGFGPLLLALTLNVEWMVESLTICHSGTVMQDRRVLHIPIAETACYADEDILDRARFALRDIGEAAFGRHDV